MKAKDWLYIAGITLLAVLLLRAEFCTKPKTVEVVRWKTVNLDSLKAKMPRDTVFVPGPPRQVLRYVTVTIPDQTTADSLAQRYAELETMYRNLQIELQSAWMQEGGQGVELQVEQHTYSDSITTAQYFHRWEISAEGPVTSYSFGIVPICPQVQPQKVRMHRAGLFAGGQTMPGGLRPAFGLGYGYGPLRLQGAYLPATQGQPAQGQLLMGVEIGIR